MNYSISVVIPMFNASRTIIRALNSVESQCGTEFHEVIIIDDGSTDDSSEKVINFSKSSKLNIKLHRQENAGVSSARNLGIKKSNSKYIAFLDSDDEWLPFKTAEQMPLFSLPGPGVVMVGGNHTKNSHKLNDVARIDVSQQLFRNHFQTSTIIVSKDIANRVGGFYINQRYAEEGRFYFDMLKYGSLILLNKQVVVYDGGNKIGFGESGLSKNLFAMQKGEMSNINHAFEEHKVSPYIIAIAHLFSLAKFIRRFILVYIRRLAYFKRN
ncbi:glycosyltransferase family A protein [Aeromonas hydrophila]|uniref:glycosyltransferase family A protein n=1 Tax=Aeromonas hydrophila TaxID=644 RepID=UPI0009BBE451|nr:glycosyltransferase family 2 protein [Aeromonas hydrophila]ELM3749664.1 glycosyltransferase family 2 protein [Aeromonas dhakensis]QGZ72379.1 glycosyltransferase [Aeromonas hydrophila]HEB5079634.1 glycosyltransferase family 2 protein [Aeromonas hydrophila subsp. hydrophila]